MQVACLFFHPPPLLTSFLRRFFRLPTVFTPLDIAANDTEYCAIRLAPAATIRNVDRHIFRNSYFVTSL